MVEGQRRGLKSRRQAKAIAFEPLQKLASRKGRILPPPRSGPPCARLPHFPHLGGLGDGLRGLGGGGGHGEHGAGRGADGESHCCLAERKKEVEKKKSKRGDEKKAE